MKISLTSILFDRALREPLGTAILTPQETITYGDLAGEAAGFAALLHSQRLQGRRVSLLLPNIPRFASVLHGVLGGGGTAVMTNPLNSPREVREQCTDAEVAAVVTVAGLRPLLPEGIPALIVDQLPSGVLLLRDGEEHLVPLPRSEAFPVQARGSDEEAAILFTSADRGRARGAVLSHRNLVANLRSTVEMMALEETDRMLSALPQVHAFGLTVGLNAPLAAGATVVPVERFHPARVMETLETLRPTVFAGVPAMFMAMLSVLERVAVPEHALRLTLSGGAPVHPDVQRSWEESFGVPLVLMQCNTNYTGSLDNFRHVHLHVLRIYREMFPEAILGLSDHTPQHATVHREGGPSGRGGRCPPPGPGLSRCRGRPGSRDG